jgi:hypothetical protein
LYREGLEVNHTERLRGYLEPGRSVILFTDNCGELVFDSLLCCELKKFKISLTLVVKECPVLSDATLQDLREVNARGVRFSVDSVMTSGGFAVGIDFNLISDALRTKIETADLIICKGMANFESFSETSYRPVLYLLRTKCAPVATALGEREGINLAKLYE